MTTHLANEELSTYKEILLILQAFLSQRRPLQGPQSIAIPVNPLIIAMTPALKMDQHLALLIVDFFNS